MRRALVGSALLGTVACGGGSAAPAPAESILRTGPGAEVGRVTLREKGDRVLVHLRVAGLPPGLHGVHLHAVALCEGPAFQSAGGHLNPARTQHGRLNPQGPHVGDLGNLPVGSDGRGEATLTVGGTSPSGGLKALLGEMGISLVVHADRDDERTDPSGNSGARIACAVIQP